MKICKKQFQRSDRSGMENCGKDGKGDVIERWMAAHNDVRKD